MFAAHQTDIYSTWRWHLLRWFILKLYGHRCRKCGDLAKPGNPIQVDHVFAKARGRKGERLKWKWWNLQPMHKRENHEKGTGFEDYRYLLVRWLYPISDDMR